MELKEVTVSRKFNLGNYQMIEIGLVATVGPGDKAADVAKALDKKIVEIRNGHIDKDA